MKVQSVLMSLALLAPALAANIQQRDGYVVTSKPPPCPTG